MLTLLDMLYIRAYDVQAIWGAMVIWCSEAQLLKYVLSEYNMCSSFSGLKAECCSLIMSYHVQWGDWCFKLSFQYCPFNSTPRYDASISGLVTYCISVCKSQCVFVMANLFGHSISVLLKLNNHVQIITFLWCAFKWLIFEKNVF